MKEGLFDLLEGSGPALGDAMAGFAEAARQGDVAASVYALRAGAAAAVLDLEQPAPEGVATWCATLKEAALADLVPIYEAILRPDVDPKPPPTGYVEADRLCFGGWAEIRQGRADAGISQLRRFLRQCTRHPLTAVAQCGLAIGLVEAGQDYGAIEQAQTVLRATTGYAVPYRALASAYAHLGRMAEAEEAAKRALRLRRGDTVAELRARSGFAQEPETERYFEGLARAGYTHT
jgi:tetratricopeptide (TPR) repeat protein